MPQQFTVAAGQFAPAVGRPEQNARTAARLAAEASAMGARFILFPEMIITGHDAAGKDLRPTAIPLDHPAVAILQNAAAEHDIAISAGMVEETEEGYYCTQPVACPDGSLPYQRKGCAPDADDWKLDDDRTLIEVDGLRICIMICADSKHQHLWQRVEELSPDLVCHPSAGYDWWFHEGEEPDPEELKAEHAKMFSSIQSAQKRALELDCAYMVSNPIGPTATVYWPGNSGIVDRDGAVVAWLPGEVVIERMRPGYVVGHITAGTQS